MHWTLKQVQHRSKMPRRAWRSRCRCAGCTSVALAKVCTQQGDSMNTAEAHAPNILPFIRCLLTSCL